MGRLLKHENSFPIRFAKDFCKIVGQRIFGATRAEVMLQPVNLLHLETLLRDHSASGRIGRLAMARSLAFGDKNMARNVEAFL